MPNRHRKKRPSNQHDHTTTTTTTPAGPSEGNGTTTTPTSSSSTMTTPTTAITPITTTTRLAAPESLCYFGSFLLATVTGTTTTSKNQSTKNDLGRKTRLLRRMTDEELIGRMPLQGNNPNNVNNNNRKSKRSNKIDGGTTTGTTEKTAADVDEAADNLKTVTHFMMDVFHRQEMRKKDQFKQPNNNVNNDHNNCIWIDSIVTQFSYIQFDRQSAALHTKPSSLPPIINSSTSTTTRSTENTTTASAATVATATASTRTNQDESAATTTTATPRAGLVHILDSHDAVLRTVIMHAAIRGPTINEHNKEPPPSHWRGGPSFQFPTKGDLCSFHDQICCPPGSLLPNHHSRNFRHEQQQQPPPQKVGGVTRSGSKTLCPGGPALDNEFVYFGNAMEVLHERWITSLTTKAAATVAAIAATVADTGPSTPQQQKQQQQQPQEQTSYDDTSSDNVIYRLTYHSVALAAIMLYGMCDLHCFVDGNGRMARLCTNWVLRRVLGLPFPITLTGTPELWSEYVTALTGTTHNIYMFLENGTGGMTAGTVTTTTTHHGDSEMARARSTSSRGNGTTLHPSGHHPPAGVDHNGTTIGSNKGVFERLTHLLLDRIAQAVVECQQHIKEADIMYRVEKEEAKVARAVRERAASGHCIICLEDHPNILTICCGQAVHMNCLAEWLHRENTCVACRKSLPNLRIRGREVRVGANARTRNHLPADHPLMLQSISPAFFIDDEEEVEEVDDAVGRTDPRNDVWNAVLTNMLWDAAGMSQGHGVDMDNDRGTIVTTDEVPYCVNQGCYNRAALDCENHMCGRCCPGAGMIYCVRHDGGEMDDEGGSIATTDDEVNYCQSEDCNNLAASGCTNLMCGRCCRETGTTHCYRHNGGFDHVRTDRSIRPVDSTNHDSNDVFCCSSGCSNRAAMDCGNGMCGHCCRTGMYNCERHGVFM